MSASRRLCIQVVATSRKRRPGTKPQRANSILKPFLSGTVLSAASSLRTILRRLPLPMRAIFVIKTPYEHKA